VKIRGGKMQRNIDRDDKLAKAWSTGKYKSYSSLARAYKTYPKAVQRAVQRAVEAINATA
jgi:O6-methylguanine-DNA--protein-cysteine methyltransferase